MNDNRATWFDDLLLAYRPFIYKRCLAEPNVDVEETVHDVMLRAMEKWHQYKPNYNFAVWLSFMCRDVLRERRRPSAMPTDTMVVQPVQEETIDIARALSHLTKRESIAVTMLAVGNTKFETASKMRLSRQGLNNVMARARAKMAANDNGSARKAA